MMFKLHPILSNENYKLLKPAYRVCDDIEKAPDLALPSHQLAQKWQLALSSEHCFAYGYGIDEFDRPTAPIYLIVDCQQISHNRFGAIVKTLSPTLTDEVLSLPFGIEFTHYGDMAQIELLGERLTPIIIRDVVSTFNVIDQ